MTYLRPTLGIVLLCAAAGAAPEADRDRIKADEEAIQKAGLSTEGPALVEFFRKRTPGSDTTREVSDLIGELGDDSFHVRENASQELIEVGPSALSFLKKAVAHPDLEVAHRAKRCIKLIQKGNSPALVAAAVRLLAERGPDGAVLALLNYLPFATEEYVANEVRRALCTVAVPNGNPHEAILDALRDDHPIRRAAAGVVLARAGGKDYRDETRQLLQDKEPLVRLRVAVALVERKDKEAVDSLIDLLTEVPAEEVWRIEQVLMPLAGKKAPAWRKDNTEKERQRYRADWQKWWNNNKAMVKLEDIDLERRILGHTLLVQRSRSAKRVPGAPRVVYPGKVSEVGPGGKEIWKIEKDLNYPITAEVIGPGRVLIAEYRGKRVTERSFEGKILWEKKFNTYVTGAQRMPGGKTLVSLRNQLVVVDRQGTQKVLYTSKNGYIPAAKALSNGQTVLIDARGNVIRLDARGQQIEQFQAMPTGKSYGVSIDVLPNGNVLVPIYSRSKVIEYTRDGRKVWEANTSRPTGAQRLPNGNTLVTCYSPPVVMELNRDGKPVKKKAQANNFYLMEANRR